MIRPTKGIAADRALLSVGAEVLRRLDKPRTVSRLWEHMRQRRVGLLEAIPYDWFVLALTLLFAIGAIRLEDGRLHRIGRTPAG